MAFLYPCRVSIVGLLGVLVLSSGCRTEASNTEPSSGVASAGSNAGSSGGHSGSAGAAVAAGASNADPDAGVLDGPALPIAAGNGAPLPPPDPLNNCDALAVEVAPCELGALCPALTCDCASGKLYLFSGFSCTAAGCASAVACDVACEVGIFAMTTVSDCVAFGMCEMDSDCGEGRRCMRPSGQRRGLCSTGGGFSACLLDSDCASSACVTLNPAVRRCLSREEGIPCNRDSHCAAGRCLLESDHFLGVCADGTNFDFCYRAADCNAGLNCLGNEYSQCSDGEDGSLCNTPADCREGFACIPTEFMATTGLCSAGGIGESCACHADCERGSCALDAFDQGTCVAPSPLGNACELASQCESDFCGGVCTNGGTGAACRSAEDCLNGNCVVESDAGDAQCAPFAE